MLEESVRAERNEPEDASCDAVGDETEGGNEKCIDFSSLCEMDETSVDLDAEFTSCGEHPDVVGRCFLEVRGPDPMLGCIV